MKKLIFVFSFYLFSAFAFSQKSNIDKENIQEDFNQIIERISNQYVYLDKKKVNMDCIKQTYSEKIETLKNQGDVILFFEYLLNEFYDSHISLTTNIWESYRLSTPIYTELVNGKPIIKNVWQTQISNLEINILGAEILKFNGVDFNQQIEAFPSLCNDKSSLEVRNWIANKVLSGKYSEPRVLSLKLKDGKLIDFDLDALEFYITNQLLTVKTINDIGVIRLNNSLGNNKLISEFDQALDTLLKTKGLIIDLRNTNNGGNTYVAKGIMSRFIDKELPYQKHYYVESYNNQPKIARSWVEYVSPRGSHYNKPVVILVGRWTGSMGEGMAIGFDGINRAEILGTEMKRLAGSDFDFRFKNQNFGYKLVLEKLYHIDGTPREEFVPKTYVVQSILTTDETMEKGIELITKLAE